MKKILALCFALLASHAQAADTYPKGAVLLGKGPGYGNFGWAVTSSSGLCLMSNGAAVPSFQSCPGGSGNVQSLGGATGIVLLGSNLQMTGQTLSVTGLTIGTNVQAWDADLDCISALSSTGLMIRTGTGTCSAGSLSGDLTTSGSVATIANNAVSNAKSAQMAAVTLKGNPTNATANASDFTIGGLTTLGAPDAVNDYLLIWDHTAGTFKKINPGTIASSATAGVSSFLAVTGAITGSSDFVMSGSQLQLATSNGTGAVVKATNATVTNQTSSDAYTVSNAANAFYKWLVTGAAADEKGYRIYADVAGLHFDLVNDAGTVATRWLDIARSGINIVSVSLHGPLIFDGLTNCGNGLGTSSTGLVRCVRGSAVSLDNYSTYDCTGATASDAAITSAKTSFSSILFPNTCTTKISSNMTWDAGKNYIFPCSSKLSVDNTFTVTIKGTFTADHNCQIFTGAGTATGIRKVRPEWWGATNTGSAGAHNDATAINAAIASTVVGATGGSDGDVSEFKISCGNGYYVTSDVVFLPSKFNNLKVTGCGSVGAGGGGGFVGAGTGFTNGIVVIRGETVASGNYAMDFTFKDFYITHITTNASVNCLSVAPAGYKIEGYSQALIENLHTSACNTHVSIGSARQIVWDRNGLWMDTIANQTGIYVNAQGAATGDAGDMDWRGGQIRCGDGSITGGISSGIVLRSVVAGGNIAGFRFNSTVLYGCGTNLQTTVANGGTMGDIWFLPGMQIDGKTGIVWNSDVTGTSPNNRAIANIRFDNFYVTAQCGVAFRAAGQTTAQIVDVLINNIRLRGNCGGGTNRFVALENAPGFTVTGNQIFDFTPAGSEMISVFNSPVGTVSNNVADNHGAARTDYFVTTSGTSTFVVGCANSVIGAVGIATLNPGSVGTNSFSCGNLP